MTSRTPATPPSVPPTLPSSPPPEPKPDWWSGLRYDERGLVACLGTFAFGLLWFIGGISSYDGGSSSSSYYYNQPDNSGAFGATLFGALLMGGSTIGGRFLWDIRQKRLAKEEEEKQEARRFELQKLGEPHRTWEDRKHEREHIYGDNRAREHHEKWIKRMEVRDARNARRWDFATQELHASVALFNARVDAWNRAEDRSYALTTRQLELHAQWREVLTREQTLVTLEALRQRFGLLGTFAQGFQHLDEVRWTLQQKEESERRQDLREADRLNKQYKTDMSRIDADILRTLVDLEKELQKHRRGSATEYLEELEAVEDYFRRRQKAAKEAGEEYDFDEERRIREGLARLQEMMARGGR